MSEDRKDYLLAKLQRFLKRKDVPDGLEGPAQDEARHDEIRALARLIVGSAPTLGFEVWWDEVEAHVGRSMRSRAWPNEGQLASSIEAVRRGRIDAGDDGTPVPLFDRERINGRILDMLEAHYRQHGREAPGIGTSERTAALISRGVLANEREARFLGFSVDQDQLNIAMGQPAGDLEWNHHVAIMARLRGQSLAAADHQCRAELSQGMPAAPGNPVKRFPEVPQDPQRGQHLEPSEPTAPAGHWTQRVDPNGPEMEALRQSRIRHGLIPKPQEETTHGTQEHDDPEPGRFPPAGAYFGGDDAGASGDAERG
jgi:hypothetical protein